jgi:hypothetical protein
VVYAEKRTRATTRNISQFKAEELVPERAYGDDPDPVDEAQGRCNGP